MERQAQSLLYLYFLVGGNGSFISPDGCNNSSFSRPSTSHLTPAALVANARAISRKRFSAVALAWWLLRTASRQGRQNLARITPDAF
jgi:hypothetical protein